MKQIISFIVISVMLSCNNSSKPNQEAVELNDQALLLSQNSHYDSALVLFDKAIEIDNKYYLPHANKIDVYLAKSDYSKALNESKKVNLKKPDLAEGWFFTGLLNKHEGYKNEAKHCFEKSIKIYSERIQSPERENSIVSNIANRAIAKIFIEDDSYIEDINSLNDYGNLKGVVEYFKEMTPDEIMNELLQ